MSKDMFMNIWDMNEYICDCHYNMNQVVMNACMKE